MLSAIRQHWLIVGLSALVALAMEVLFVRFPTPLSFLTVLTLYFVCWAVIMRVHRTWRSSWPLLGLVPAAFLAYAFLFRVDPDMWFFEVLTLGLLSLTMTGSVPLKIAQGTLFKISSLPFFRHPFAVLRRGVGVIKPVLQIRLEAGWKRQAIVGALMSIPLLLIFGALFYSADSVFKHVLHHFEWLKNIIDLVSISGLARIIRFVVWLVALAGVWSYMVADDYASIASIAKNRSVPQTTVLVIIGLLSALFVLFNVAQLVGLVFKSGLPMETTYATYAREGFGQLVAALLLAFLLVWKLCYLYGRATLPRAVQIGLFIFLSQLVPLVFSSWHRLNLYQDAYGFTVLRLYAEWGIVASLPMLLVFVLVVLGKIRYERVAHIVALGALCWFAGVAAVGPSYLVAKRNVDRFVSGKDYSLDARYLTSLSADSVRAWQGLQDPALRERLQLSDGRSSAQNYLVKRLTVLADTLPYYGVQIRPGEQDVLWNYHPGEHRLKVLVDQLLAGFVGLPQSSPRNVNVVR